MPARIVWRTELGQQLRRYRITERRGSQLRWLAGYLFGFIKPDALKGITG